MSAKRTQATDAEYFVRMVGGLAKFDHARGAWLFFEDHAWRRDSDGKATRLAIKAMRQMAGEASRRVAESVDDLERAEALLALQWATRGESRARLEAMIHIARTLEPVADDGEGWDSDPWLLGVANGVIDLRTGELRDGRPEDRITLQTPVPYFAHAECPRWERFIREISNDDPQLTEHHQRRFGEALTGIVTEQKVSIFYGLGSNGKSTLLDVMRAVMGPYAWSMPFPDAGWSSSVTEYQKAQLVGRRLVIAVETAQTKHLNTELVKSLSGGDQQNARHPYGRPFAFSPVMKLFIAVNHRPIVRDESFGLWRRLLLVPFERTFPKNETLLDELKAEAPGILAWAVRGCLAWQRDGLRAPQCVAAATAEYQSDSDHLVNFVEERCEIDPAATVAAKDLFDAYRAWCDANQLREGERLSNRTFGPRIKGRFQSEEKRGRVAYLGLKLRPVDEDAKAALAQAATALADAQKAVLGASLLPEHADGGPDHVGAC
jgi:putative DNA primase/helicase